MSFAGEDSGKLQRATRVAGGSVQWLAVAGFLAALIQFRERECTIGIDVVALWLLYLGYQVSQGSRRTCRLALGVSFMFLLLYGAMSVIAGIALHKWQVAYPGEITISRSAMVSLCVEIVRTTWYAVNVILLSRCLLVWQKLDRSARGLCRKCGYNLHGSSDRCPECGTPFELYRPVITVPIAAAHERRGP